MKNGEIEVPYEGSDDVKKIVDNLNEEYSNLEVQILKQYEHFNKDNMMENN